MAVRDEVRALVDAGPFPSDDDATEEELTTIERLLTAIRRPVTDEEAVLLTTAFGPDDCYGLSWTLLHLIETAPTEAYAQGGGDNEWTRLLRARIENAR